ncbi:SAM-dependent methyltransferase [Streptomyces sp. NPDC048172]|uniref:SAM-dependent methyltransferase n=1 Tax=Streptomyces sp. NPDC048172 TaxID=3365505 RepID=UPI0037219442
MTADSAPLEPGQDDIDTSRPNAARMYDYFLGGTTHFPADRAAAQAALESMPTVPGLARSNRAFLHRATRVLAGRYGVRQFLDVGSGIPTEPNLHRSAQAVAPDARVVYTDSDPTVRKLSGRLLESCAAEGRAVFLEADVRDPEGILGSPEVTGTLDLRRPVALSVLALLHFVPDDEEAYGCVARLLAALPSGSFLVLSHLTADFAPEAVARANEPYRRSGIEVRPRTRDELLGFFDGLDLLAPGMVRAHQWHPEAQPEGLGEVEVLPDAAAPFHVAVGITR